MCDSIGTVGAFMCWCICNKLSMATPREASNVRNERQFICHSLSACGGSHNGYQPSPKALCPNPTSANNDSTLRCVLSALTH